jgi:hypothetical protein
MFSGREFWIGVIVGVVGTFAYHKFVGGGLGPAKP